MQSEAAIEAKRLAASLRSIDADLAKSAKGVSLALAGHPSHKALMGAAARLEVIEGQLPPGMLASLVRFRLVHLKGLVNALLETYQ
ncbi:hypothetical protein LL947_10715 [Halomonas sp. BLK-85]